MDERTAKAVILLADRATVELDEMVRIAMESGMDQEEFNKFRRSVGQIMGELYLDIMTPIFDAFPHLVPPELVPPKPESS